MSHLSLRSLPTCRPLAGAILILASAIGWRASAQTPPPVQTPAPQATTQKTTAIGVYTAEQAKRGEDSFGSLCMGCHTLSSFNNAKFKSTWNGRPLFEFVAQVVDTMPEDAPGSLSEAEYAQIVAFILKLNQVPDGKSELPLDPEWLKQVVIALAPAIDQED